MTEELTNVEVVNITNHSTEKERWSPEDEGIGCCGGFTYFILILLFILTFPISIFFAIYTVNTYERAIVLRFGRLKRFGNKYVLGAGLHFVLPCAERIRRIDLRTQTVNIPPQEVLTKDSVTITVDAVVFMRVIEPAAALLRVENASKSAELLAISALRTVLGSYELTYLLTNRDEIDTRLAHLLDEGTDNWGIDVERVEITDISLPQDMQRAMAAEAQASRAAKAKIIAAQGELDAATALRKAATEISQSPAALQLRYLQTLTTIAAEQNSTIVFPLPIDLLQNMFGKKNN